MRWIAVSDLVTEPWAQNEFLSVAQFGLHLAFQAKGDVAFRAPVIGFVTRRVFDHPHSDVANCVVCQRARPVSPRWSVAVIWLQSVIENGNFGISMQNTIENILR